ncbi:hypothetical protein KM043_006797 [Ampulex compressa]|nr:hypothetical protein KM043_006797 [Ampulex compressa]
MQEGRAVSPLGPVVLPREEADMRAGLPLPSQERRHVLLHVRTAEPFVRYDSVRHSPSASPILRSVVEKEHLHEMEAQGREKRREKEMEEEEEQEDDEEDETERTAVSRRNAVEEEEDEEEQDEEEEEEHPENRNGSYQDDEDVEVDVCREEVDESNPSSPVDLTAPSSRGTEQFLNPFANRGLHPFSCVQSGAQAAGQGTPVYISGHGAAASTVMTVCTSGNAARTTGTATGSITTTANTVQANKRCLAFSVENILDPNKFTGGRVVHNRVQHRRHRRTGSVHEGE